MADDELRASERAWRAAPDDPAARARHHAAALRRAGRAAPVPSSPQAEPALRSGREVRAPAHGRLSSCDANGVVHDAFGGGVSLGAHRWISLSYHLRPDLLRSCR